MTDRTEILEHELQLWKGACEEWLEKTEWVQETSEPSELGLHRADVLRRRIEQLEAQLKEEKEYAANAARRVLRAELAERAVVKHLQGLRPEIPPFPPSGSGLPRYGLRWNGSTQPLSVPMDDGYWTPWHLAERLLLALRKIEEESDAVYSLDAPTYDQLDGALEKVRDIARACVHDQASADNA